MKHMLVRAAAARGPGVVELALVVAALALLVLFLFD
jgi:hypothetical protein